MMFMLIGCLIGYSVGLFLGFKGAAGFGVGILWGIACVYRREDKSRAA